MKQFHVSRLSISILTAVLAVVAYVAAQQSSTTGNPQEAWKAPERASMRKNPVAADEAAIAAGKLLYAQECLSCHGTQGKGDGPAASGLTENPGNLSSPAMWDQTDGALFWKITTGKKPMPTEEFRLTPEQRWQVVDYVRTLAPGKPGQKMNDSGTSTDSVAKPK